jgi:dolichol kinase
MAGILLVLHLASVVEVDTRRKVFHGIMVAMLLPTIFVDPCFTALALSLILAIFLLLDLFRASQLPPISKPLTAFLAPYVDGRDHRGPVIVSHIFLLIGCAIPLWLSLAGAPRHGDDPWAGWETSARDLSMVSGVICVGMGDAAASLIGRRYGRTKWFWGGGKSIEGSIAFAVAVTMGLLMSWLWLRLGGWVSWQDMSFWSALWKCIIAASGASLMESTLTAANDNVVVPIGLWLLVRGLEI